MKISNLSVEIRERKTGFVVSVWQWWLFFGIRIHRLSFADYSKAVEATKNFMVYYGEQKQGWTLNEE